MSAYNNKYNKDDVYTRSMIVCLLAELNKKIYYYNRLDDNKVEKISVPCLYSITGQERFLKDEFYYDALNEGKAIGDYERVPRCIINLTGLTINTSEQTNKYNHTKIVRESNGVLRTLFLNVEYIPVTLNFDCKVIAANNIELFKIIECIISKIYKNPNYFKVDFGMFNVDACLEVPSDYNHEIPTEFGLNEKKEFSFSFSTTMKSFIPTFEHGLLLPEIDEILAEIPAEAVGPIEYRADKYGVMKLLPAGVFEEFESNLYDEHIPEPNIKSNKNKSLNKDKLIDKREHIK